MAPSSRDLSSSGTISSGSTSSARTDTGALGAGAEGRVEGEGAGLQLLERQVVVRAVQVLRTCARARGRPGEVDEVEHDHAAGEPEGGLHGVGETALGGVLHREAVDGPPRWCASPASLQRGRLGELDRLTVDLARLYPLVWRSAKRSTNSPLRSRTSSEGPGNGFPRAAPEPCRRWPAGDWRVMGRRHSGQCGLPMRAKSDAGSRRPR